MKNNLRKGSSLSRSLLIRFFKGSSLGILTAGFLVSGLFVSGGTALAVGVAPAVISVTGITPVANSGGWVGYATANGFFENGWRWVFDVTVPMNETVLKMKFGDWISGPNTIPAANNIRFYSAQSSNASTTGSALFADNTYSGEMDLIPSSDLRSHVPGRQIQITVEARVPVGSAGGSYSTSYGIQSNPDTTAPVITLLGTNPQTIEGGSTYIDAGATALDNVDGDITSLIAVVGLPVNTSVLGDHTVTYNVSDAAGNPATQVARTVNVVDTTPPVIASHDNVTAEATSASGAVVNYGSPATSDNVDPAGTATCLPASGSTFPLGVTTVTCNSTDAADNAATPTSFTVTVQDTTKPTIALNGSDPVTLEVHTPYADAGAVAHDNYDADAAVATPDSVNVDVVGTYTLTYNHTDTNGNAATSVTRTVNVVDTTKPAITLVGANPQVIEVGTAYSELGATVSDNYDTGLSATIDTSKVDTSKVDSYTVTYDAVDSSGNHADQVTRTVNVVDTIKPVFGARIGTAGTTGETTIVGVTVNDNVSVASAEISFNGGGTYTSMTETPASVARNNPQQRRYTFDVSVPANSTDPINYTIQAFDGAGNSATTENTITVTDNDAPVITLLGDSPITVAVGSTYTDAGATALDNVDGDLTSKIAVINSVNTAAVGAYTVTYNVSDAALNAATEVTRTVNVAANVTTDAATDVTPTDATLNGTNGPSAADHTSFWWGTSDPDPSYIAAGVPLGLQPGWSYTTNWTETPSRSAGEAFSAAVTGLTPGTTYHFVAWSLVGSTWYPGAILNFTTAASTVAPSPVDLGAASSFAILTYAGITDSPASIITGNIGASPITGAGIGVTCSEVTGIVYSVNDAGPSCEVIDSTLLTTAMTNMGTAYTDALSRATNVLNTGNGAGEIGGQTLAPGVYTFTGDSVNVTIATALTLHGGADDVWIFQIPGTFGVSANVILTGDAQAKNIFWAVAGATTIYPGFTVNGTILDYAGIAMQSGATLNGRALSQTASVTLIADTVTVPDGIPAPATYTVTFDKNGGDTDASPASITGITSGATVTLPADPTLAGNTFAGWNTQANGLGTSFDGTTAVTTNITVYAQWTANITTNAATDVTPTDATLNGTNGPADATGHSFWVSLNPSFAITGTDPAADGASSTLDLGFIAANATSSASLSSAGITVTPSTTYYFAACSDVGGTWYHGAILNFTTAAAPAPLPGVLSAEDFGVMNQSGVIGYTAGFGLSDATFVGVQSMVVKLYSGTTLLQTNTLNVSSSKVITDITGTEISGPFDVFGGFDYVADGYWTNVREAEYGQTLTPTKVVATVTLANGKVVTAENTDLTGDLTIVTTKDATDVTLTDATLNGTNGPADAAGHSFWVSTSTFSTASPTIPAGVYSTADLGSIASSTAFSASLSSITTTGLPTNLPEVTPGTTYYYAAWSNVGGTWYPGEILNFTTGTD